VAKASVELCGLEEHSLASNIVQLYTQWNAGRQVWLKRVKEVIAYVYATSTRETSNVTNPWSHSTVIPKLTQIHDNLGANYASALFTSREFFTFEPGRPDEASLKKRTAIENYLRTKHDYSRFRAVMKQLLDDWVQTGNCFCRVEYIREMEVEPITGAPIITYEGPRVVRISPYDIVFNHALANFKDSPKIIRELITRGELMRRFEDSPEGAGYDPAEIERIKKFYSVVSGWKEADINKNIQMHMDGFSSPSQFLNSGNVELLHFIGDIYDSHEGVLHKSKLITIVDRRYVLQNTTLDDLQGFGRIYHAGWRKRTDNLWSQGPLDNLVGMQYLINHLENARADAFDQMLSPDRVHIGAVEIERDGAVTNYFVDDANGDVRNLSPDPMVLNADNQIAMKEAQMEAYAGAPREAMGIRSPGEKTAFEVSSLQNAAGRLFQTKIEDFEQDLIEPVLNGELEVAVKNLATADLAKVLDDDFGVIEFMTITRDDLTARGKLKARGASHYAKRAQLVQELQQFGNILATDPSLAIHFPSKARAKAWNDAMGFDRLELFKAYGQIEEEVEKAQHQQAAQQYLAESEAAATTETDIQQRLGEV